MKQKSGKRKASRSSMRVTVRLKDSQYMLLTELAAIQGVQLSVLVRALLVRQLDELLDDDGNWKQR